MPTIRVYVDSSVFGGVEDDEFAEPSRRFFEDVRRGRYVIVLSDQVYRELERAPKPVREGWKSLPGECVEEAPMTADVERLAEAYIAAGVLSKSAEDDARHVAAATVASADVIVSWNFRHIVNRERIRGYNAVNVLNGYREIEIYSPQEMGGEGEKEV